MSEIIEAPDNDRNDEISRLAGEVKQALNKKINEIKESGNLNRTRYVVVEVRNTLVYGSETILLGKEVHNIMINTVASSKNLCVSIKENTYTLEVTLDRTKT